MATRANCLQWTMNCVCVVGGEGGGGGDVISFSLGRLVYQHNFMFFSKEGLIGTSLVAGLGVR